jgi:hypothetical protein
MQMIYRWKATENTQLFHDKLFSNFQWFKFNFENRKHSKTHLKRIFHLFSNPQIRITQMIRHWKAIEIAQLFFISASFFKFATLFEQF